MNNSLKKVLYNIANSFKNLGTIYTANKSVAITTANINTYAVGASVSLPAGTYIIRGFWQFNSVSAARVTDLDITTDGNTTATTDSGLLARQRVHHGGGSWARLETTAIQKFDTATTVYVKGSASVTSTAQNTQIIAIRIK